MEFFSKNSLFSLADSPMQFPQRDGCPPAEQAFDFSELATRLPDTPHKCDSCRLSFDTDDSSPIANNRADFALSGRKRFRSKRRLQSSVPISPLAMEMNNDESLLASDTAVAEAEDEKFMDLFEKKHEKNEQEELPKAFRSLFIAPLKNRSNDEASSKKRPEMDGALKAPKKCRLQVPGWQKKTSTELAIKTAICKSEQESDLIADFSRLHCLPRCRSKHSDMQAISPNTLSDLLSGNYSHTIDEFTIVDCRYPYEYQGGHIKGAENIFTKEGIYERFMRKDEFANQSSKRRIIIFHCEFSSERGPRMYRFLREADRKANKENYPALNYPELYLLEGGYKAFHEQQKNLCVPMTYLPMLHSDFAADLKYFRTKSKSWGGEKIGRHRPRRTLTDVDERGISSWLL